MFADILISVLSFILMIVSKTAIVWGPLLLGYIAFTMWHHFVSEKFIGGIEWTMLEVEIPREITKTPMAMELFLTNALYQLTGKGVWEEYWQGAVHFWYSLELVSIDGRVHFFIRIPSRLKRLVESQLYAQYPQVRVLEVEDYTENIPRYRNNGDWHLWGCEFKKAKPDPYPIRTYVDYGMKPGTKVEDMIDPITPMIEFLGSLQRGEQVWVQFIIRASKKKFKDAHGHMHGTYADELESVIKDLLSPYTRAQKQENDPDSFVLDMRTPDFLKDDVAKISRMTDKLPFDCGIRVCVLGDKRYVDANTFNNTRRASRLIFRQYTDPSLNQLARFNNTQYEAPFSDPTSMGIQKMKSRFLTFYKLSTMYYPPLMFSFNYPKLFDFFLPSGKPEYFVMNTEELATVWHFPGMVSETPTFKRLESKTAKPPANLPM